MKSLIYGIGLLIAVGVALHELTKFTASPIVFGFAILVAVLFAVGISDERAPQTVNVTNNYTTTPPEGADVVPLRPPDGA
jgi:hypothetical protein